MMDKINVNLYGGKSLFGGKESPLEADTIFCDRYEECSFYKQGKCLNCRAFLCPRCKFGCINTIKGYTSRAAKYYTFKKEYTDDEKYNKLSYPSDVFGIIGKTIVMKIPYVYIVKKTEVKNTASYRKCVGDYFIDDPGFCSNNTLFMDMEDLTDELLFAILSFRPRAMMGGIITEYQSKVVPDIVTNLKKIIPDFMGEFLTNHPEYDLSPIYVDRYVYMYSLVDGAKIQDCHNTVYIFDKKNMQLICDCSTYKGWDFFGGKPNTLTIPVTDKMTIKVTDKCQCDENTVFA